MDNWKFKPGQKMSNNNPCHCGSGKHYKDCCKSKDRQEAHSSIKSRNLAFAKSIERIRCQSGAPGNWKEIGAFLSYHPEYVKKIHEDNLDLWQNVSFDDIMQSGEVCIASENQLATVFSTDPQPYSLVNNIKRLSIYVDKIIVIDPFHKPSYYNEDYSPLKFPERWVPNALKLMYFMTFLEPWIRNDTVILLPNPGDFNLKFRDDMERLAGERVDRNPIRIGWDGLKGNFSVLVDMARQLAPDSDDNIKRIFTQEWGETSERKTAEFLDFVKTVRQTDPLVFRGKMPERGWTEWGSGVVAEMHVNLAHYFKAFPSTFYEFEWNGLLSVTEESQIIANEWLPFTRTLQHLSLPFFDEVDNEIALELRSEGYLSTVRDFMRQAWIESGGSHNENVISDMTKELKSVHDTAINQSKSLEIDFSKGRWGKLKTDESEILNDLGLGIVYGIIKGSILLPADPQQAALQVLGSIVWDIGRSIAHKVMWPHWQFKRVMKNPAALFFIRLDRTKRV